MTATLVQQLPGSIDTLVAQVLGEACDRRLKLATAESCTGGLIASLLTDMPGRSHAFERAFVVYTDEAKHEMLGVPKVMLEVCGAVSTAVARAMAEGAIDRSRADIVCAVTGFAGRGASGEEPGLVHFAAARRGRAAVTLTRRFGDVGRERVRIAAATCALELIRAQIV